MNTQATTDADKRHHFPSEIIAHGVWLYFRFCLSYRDVEELLRHCHIWTRPQRPGALA
jgi:transposase-like protein